MRKLITLEKTVTMGVIFVLVVAILLVVRYGIFMGPNPIPDKCVFSSDFRCNAWTIDVETDRIQITIENNLGEDVIVKRMILTEGSYSQHHRCEMTSREIPIPNGASAPIIMDNCSVEELLPGYRYNYDMEVRYQYVGSEEVQIRAGELITEAEEWSAT